MSCVLLGAFLGGRVGGSVWFGVPPLFGSPGFSSPSGLQTPLWCAALRSCPPFFLLLRSSRRVATWLAVRARVGPFCAIVLLYQPGSRRCRCGFAPLLPRALPTAPLGWFSVRLYSSSGLLCLPLSFREFAGYDPSFGLRFASLASFIIKFRLIKIVNLECFLFGPRRTKTRCAGVCQLPAEAGQIIPA
jgi:hypothetical protein